MENEDSTLFAEHAYFIRPFGFFVQEGCCDCANCFSISDWDSPIDYYCTWGGPPRPRYDGDEDRHAPRGKDRDCFEKWGDKRRVPSRGMCPRFVKKDGEACNDW
jgi:hypothetical protein